MAAAWAVPSGSALRPGTAGRDSGRPAGMESTTSGTTSCTSWALMSPNPALSRTATGLDWNAESDVGLVSSLLTKSNRVSDTKESPPEHHVSVNGRAGRRDPPPDDDRMALGGGGHRGSLRVVTPPLTGCVTYFD